MRILYFGCHGVLDWDELRLLDRVCTRLFSIGFYTDPSAPSADIRPSIEIKNYDWEGLQIWKERGLSAESVLNDAYFISRFDIVILAHSVRPIQDRYEPVSLPIVIRTIGQNDAAAEAWLSHVKKQVQGNIRIVRYSPAESNIAHYAGHDAIIRFGKFENDFRRRNRSNSEVVSFGSNLMYRVGACNVGFYLSSTYPFDRALYCEDIPLSNFTRRHIPYDQQLEIMSQAGVFYSLHTSPASYVLNLIEAMMAGCPVVAPGRRVIAEETAIEQRIRMPEAYETPEILGGAPIKLTLDSIEEAHATIDKLLKDQALADEVGRWCRSRAIELFGAATIIPQWGNFLRSVISS